MDRALALPQRRNHGANDRTCRTRRYIRPRRTKAWRPRGTKPRRSATRADASLPRRDRHCGIKPRANDDATATAATCPARPRSRAVASVKTLKCASVSHQSCDRRRPRATRHLPRSRSGSVLGSPTEASDHSAGSARAARATRRASSSATDSTRIGSPDGDGCDVCVGEPSFADGLDVLVTESRARGPRSCRLPATDRPAVRARARIDRCRATRSPRRSRHLSPPTKPRTNARAMVVDHGRAMRSRRNARAGRTRRRR